jgi:HlyD family secretion protein
MKKIIIPVLLLILAGATGWHFYSKYRHDHEPLKLYGNVDIRGVDLGFRVSGRLSEVLRDEGDSVKTGEVLARIDRDPYVRELEQAKATLAAAEADLQMKRAGYRPEEIEQARATAEQNRVSLNNAARNFQRQNALVKGGGTSQQSFDDAEAMLEEAKQRSKVADANLRQLEAGFRAEEIQASLAQMEQARASVALAEIRLADTELRAPSDGILLTRAVEPGAIVQAGSTALSLSLEKPVWVRAYVHEAELGEVSPGTRVLVFTDGNPDKPFHGTVGFVSPRAEFTPKSVETPHLRTSLVYRLRVVVSDSDGTLRQGMPVTVSLDSSSI